jgi:hypothetical protein
MIKLGWGVGKRNSSGKDAYKLEGGEGGEGKAGSLREGGEGRGRRECGGEGEGKERRGKFAQIKARREVPLWMSLRGQPKEKRKWREREIRRQGERRQRVRRRKGWRRRRRGWRRRQRGVAAAGSWQKEG